MAISTTLHWAEQILQTASAKFQVGARSRQCRGKLFKDCLILLVILGLQSFLIHQFPSNRRKTANGWRVYQALVWSERMKRPQEELRGVIQTRTNLRNQFLSRCEECIQRGFANRHSGKLSLEGLPYVLQARLQEFVRWTIVTQNVCQKCFVKSFVDPFIRE